MAFIGASVWRSLKQVCSVVVPSANALDLQSPISEHISSRNALSLKMCTFSLLSASSNVIKKFAKQTESVAGVHQSSSHGLLSQGGRVELRAWSWRHSPPGRDPPTTFQYLHSVSFSLWWILVNITMQSLRFVKQIKVWQRFKHEMFVCHPLTASYLCCVNVAVLH